MEIIHNEKREEGGKQSRISRNILTKPADGVWRDKQGDRLPYEVARICECVSHYQTQGRAIKTVDLSEAYYDAFDYWTRKHALETEADAKIKAFTLAGVNIEHFTGIIRSNPNAKRDGMDWDFWTND